MIHKLMIYLNGSGYIEGEFKLKIHDYTIEKENPKMITLLDKQRSFQKKKSDIDKIQTDFKNDTFNSLCFYCFCYTKDIEKTTKLLIEKIKDQFKINEEIYESSKKALNSNLKIIHVI